MRLRMSEGFLRALEYAKSVDVDVEFVYGLPRYAEHKGASWEASIPEPRRILWADRRLDNLRACDLIHDVHHAVLWDLINSPPDFHQETEGMLALDHAAIRSCRLPWPAWVRTFYIGNGRWWDNDRRTLRRWLRESYQDAVHEGWMDKKHNPLLRRST